MLKFYLPLCYMQSAIPIKHVGKFIPIVREMLSKMQHSIKHVYPKICPTIQPLISVFRIVFYYLVQHNLPHSDAEAPMWYSLHPVGRLWPPEASLELLRPVPAMLLTQCLVDQ